MKIYGIYFKKNDICEKNNIYFNKYYIFFEEIKHDKK